MYFSADYAMIETVINTTIYLCLCLVGEMKGFLIVLEGSDGSGKSTHYEQLCQWLREQCVPFSQVSFPRYGKDSCKLVEAYLLGEYGTHPDDVSPYAASTFYAVDRYVSFKTDDWGRFYTHGGLILSARYTTANAVHQTAKLPDNGREEFLTWLYDFEFHRMGIPEPDLVFYLDISLELSVRRVTARSEQTHVKKDIHEMDMDYLSRSLKAGRYAAQHYGWTVIPNEIDGRERTMDEIQFELRQRVQQFLKERSMEYGYKVC